MKINISSCFVANHILEKIFKGDIDTSKIGFLKNSDVDVKTVPQQFNEVSVSEVDISSERSIDFSGLAKEGIILVKRWRINNDMEFYPKTKEQIEGDPNNYAWIKIEKIKSN